MILHATSPITPLAYTAGLSTLAGAGIALWEFTHGAVYPVYEGFAAAAVVAGVGGTLVSAATAFLRAAELDYKRVLVERMSYTVQKDSGDSQDSQADEYAPIPELDSYGRPVARLSAIRVDTRPMYASDERVYIREDDGSVSIYGVTVTQSQLARLFEVVNQPRPGNRIQLVYDDFVRGESKVFQPAAWKRFQQELVDQHIAWWGRGNRCYLTERGRRVIVQLHERPHSSPTAGKIVRKWALAR